MDDPRLYWGLKRSKNIKNRQFVKARPQKRALLDRAGVQGDFSVIGSEFVNFVVTLATCRMLRKAGIAGLLGKMSYAELLDDLSSAWRRVDAPSDPSTGDGFWVHTLKTVFEELEALGLS